MAVEAHTKQSKTLTSTNLFPIRAIIAVFHWKWCVCRLCCLCFNKNFVLIFLLFLFKQHNIQISNSKIQQDSVEYSLKSLLNNFELNETHQKNTKLLIFYLFCFWLCWKLKKIETFLGFVTENLRILWNCKSNFWICKYPLFREFPCGLYFWCETWQIY